MRKPKIVKEEILPGTLTLRPSTSSWTHTYAFMKVHRTVIDDCGKRTDEITGPPLYLHEHGDLCLAFSVALAALGEIEAAYRARMPKLKGWRLK